MLLWFERSPVCSCLLSVHQSTKWQASLPRLQGSLWFLWKNPCFTVFINGSVFSDIFKESDWNHWCLWIQTTNIRRFEEPGFCRQKQLQICDPSVFKALKAETSVGSHSYPPCFWFGQKLPSYFLVSVYANPLNPEFYFSHTTELLVQYFVFIHRYEDNLPYFLTSVIKFV